MVGQEIFDMLAANWEDHDLENNPIINYFADMFHTEQVLRKIEKLMEKKCFYCQECKNCKKHFENKNVLKQLGLFGLLTNILKSGMFVTRKKKKRTEH